MTTEDFFPAANKYTLFSPLSIPSFRWLFSGQIVSVIGNQLVPMVIIASAIPNAKNVEFTLGTIMASRFIALAMFILVGGVLADRLNKFKLLAISDIFSAIALLPIILMGSNVTVLELSILSFALGICEAIYYPTYDAALVSILDKSYLSSANALTRMIRSFAKVIGPPVAGIAVVKFGIKISLIIDACSFIISLITLLRLISLGVGSEIAKQKSTIFKDALEGIKAVGQLPWLSAIEIMAVCHVILAVGPWMVLLPIISQKNFGGMASYGVMLGAFAAGAIPGAYLGSRINIQLKGLVFLLSLIPFGILCILLGVSSNSYILVIAFFIAGIGTEMADIIKMTAIQRQVSNELLGRVFSLDFLASFMVMPLGQMLTGLFSPIGSENTIMICSGLFIILSIPFVSFIPGVASFENKPKISHSI